MSTDAFPTMLEASLPYKLVLITILSLFMVVTAVSFVRGRVNKKQAEYAEIIGFLGVRDEQGQFATRAVIDEYPWRAYVVPVAAATIVTMFGLTSLLFAAHLVEVDAQQRNVILSALFVADDPEPADLQRWQSMVVLTMAFLGAYIWCCSNIIRRLVAGDLAPLEYFNATLRMILAPLLSLMVSFLFQASGAPTVIMQSLPVIAFMTGMLPGVVLAYLEEQVRRLLKLSKDGAPELPLTMIEGLNRFHAVRLGEVGIDNAQNLAEANLIRLILKTPFNGNQLIDWIAQAKLFVYVKEAIEPLRRNGVRSAFDLAELAKDEARIRELARLTDIQELTLVTIAERLLADANIGRLAEFRLRLSPELQLSRPDPQAKQPVRVA
ncbi:MAG: hypothetical protein AAF637_22550 [Pseudomonadota bacterium]